MTQERYDNLNGIRTYACIGIIIMHIRANGAFGISGFAYDVIINSFTNLTFLFMAISAFSMCCGYYERFKNQTVSLEDFYRRRYSRIWPFFALLCTIELILEHNLNSLFEWFADLTLVFGLLPNADIKVVGVGWFLGVIFVFYMLFPFFVFLVGNKKRAWLTMTVATIMSILCKMYFMDEAHVVGGYLGRTNFLFCGMFFVSGAIVYLYRNSIKRIVEKYKWLLGIAILASIVIYYTILRDELFLVIPFSLFMMIGLSTGKVTTTFLQNKAVIILSKISMEIYLCHMFVYRLLEKVNLLHITGNELTNYILVCVATICGAIILSLILLKIIEILSTMKQRRGRVR